MKSRQRQSGLSAITILIIIMVAVFFGTCAIKLIPAYIESFTVKDVVEGVVEQARSTKMEPAEMKGALSRHFQVNQVEAIDLKDIKITRKEGKTVVDARYEKRIPLMFNIDVVLKFDQLIYEF